MDLEFSGAGSAFFAFLSTITAVVSLLTVVFWLVVGWRAMRAHEDIAASLRARRGSEE